MKHGKILVVAGMAGTVAIVGVTAVVMFRSLSDASETRTQRDNSRNDLEAYYRRNPFPSTENIERERETLATVRKWYETLLVSLQESTVPMGEPKPSVFNSRREAMMADMVASAPTGDGGQRIVPTDFSFGFEKYKTGVLADARDVPRLMRQLEMIHALVKEMYIAGVLRIESVVREEFEFPVGDTAATQPSGGSRPWMTPTPASTKASPKPKHSPVTMDAQKFTFELIANEVSLVELLNGLARMPMFTVVTKLSLAKEGADFVSAPTGDVASATLGPGGVALANPPPLSRTARIVSGRDRESRLKVSLEVEVYSFEGED